MKKPMRGVDVSILALSGKRRQLNLEYSGAYGGSAETPDSIQLSKRDVAANWQQDLNASSRAECERSYRECLSSLK